MIYKFSKPAQDILKEHTEYKNDDATKLSLQRSISKHLKNTKKRKKCVLCGSTRINESSFFSHRNIDYFCCLVCKHIQSLNELPNNYPFAFLSNGFEKIYQVEDTNEYLSRVSRIYEPKLQWIQSSLKKALYLTEEQIKDLNWLEIGSGAAFFLKALKNAGINKICGLDTNIDLINQANKICGDGHAKLSRFLTEDIENNQPNILIAFFGLEHLEDKQKSKLWECLKILPVGTIFVFSVPCLGLSTIFENSFESFAARNLDNAVHTQLFTEQSINYMLNKIGYEKISEWIFGQDIQDLIGTLSCRSQALIECGAINLEHLNSLVDKLQETIDKNRLCDARHVICVKK